MSAKPSTYLYGVIIFTLVTVAGVAMVAELRQANPDISSAELSEFNKTFNVYDNITSTKDKLQSDIENADSDTSGLNALISSSWQSLRLIGQSMKFMEKAITGISTTFTSVPSFVPPLLIALVVIMLVFAIWGAIFQRDL